MTDYVPPTRAEVLAMNDAEFAKAMRARSAASEQERKARAAAAHQRYLAEQHGAPITKESK